MRDTRSGAVGLLRAEAAVLHLQLGRIAGTEDSTVAAPYAAVRIDGHVPVDGVTGQAADVRAADLREGDDVVCSQAVVAAVLPFVCRVEGAACPQCDMGLPQEVLDRVAHGRTERVQ